MIKNKVQKKKLLCVICEKNVRLYKRLVCSICNNPPTINKHLEQIINIETIYDLTRKDDNSLHL